MYAIYFGLHSQVAKPMQPSQNSFAYECRMLVYIYFLFLCCNRSLDVLNHTLFVVSIHRELLIVYLRVESRRAESAKSVACNCVIFSILITFHFQQPSMPAYTYHNAFCFANICLDLIRIAQLLHRQKQISRIMSVALVIQRVPF